MPRVGAACALVLLLLIIPPAASAFDDDARALSRDRQQALDRAAGHLTPGEQHLCISRRRIAQTIIISDSRILYRFGRNLVYDNQLPISCTGLARSPYEPVIAHSRSMLCEGDLVEVGGSGGDICRLGRFTAWRPADPIPVPPAN